MNINRGFESASHIGIMRNNNKRVSLPWSGESIVDGHDVRWNIHLRAGKTLTVTAEIRSEDTWVLVALIEETAHGVHKHPTEAAAFQIDRAIGELLEYLVSPACRQKIEGRHRTPELLQI